MTLSIEWLLEPIAPQAFFTEYYERQSLLIACGEPRRFEPLLSLSAIDRFLATTSPCHPDVFLVDAARKLSAEDYTLADPDGVGQLDLPRAYELFRTGATISVRHLHESLPELGALCRAVEKVFSGHFQTNIYLSPPAAQAFPTHFDSHDVFVLQVAGSKVWTLYDTLIELPLHGQAFDKTKHQPGPPTREITIRAGDLCYCPRGLFHSARSTEETSLHITLGLIGKTWADVMLEAVSAACTGRAGLSPQSAGGLCRSQLRCRRGQGHLSRARGHLCANGRPRSHSAKAGRGLRDLAPPRSCRHTARNRPGTPVARDTRLVARPHLSYRLNEDGNEVTLLFGASRLSLPAAAAEPLRFALAGAPFRVNDLPGRLDEAGKVVLARRLLREGLLLRSD